MSYAVLRGMEIGVAGIMLWCILWGVALLLVRLPVGTKSLLFGVHCWFIHPFVVALAWKRLYGWPTDIRIWAAFIVHDWGYWGHTAMDSPEAEQHPVLGARIMHWLFDRRVFNWKRYNECFRYDDSADECYSEWYDFTLYHSRFLAKKNGAQFSRLCVADKAALYIEPFWFYLFRARMSGEIYEYLQQQPKMPAGLSQTDQFKWWHAYVVQYLVGWVNEHKDCREDKWTSTTTREAEVPASATNHLP